MEHNNSCYTSFSIKGMFNPDDITRILGLTPIKQWYIGDLRRNGTAYEFAFWEYGRCNEYNVITEYQMMYTIRDLMPKIELLNKIKREFDVTLLLAVVPTVYVGEATPSLSPNRKIMEFCYKTETDFDIDLYVYDSIK